MKRISKTIALWVLEIFVFSTLTVPYLDCSLWQDRHTHQTQTFQIQKSIETAIDRLDGSDADSLEKRIPPNLGTFIESWKTDPKSVPESWVIIIPEAHGHYPSQKNIATFLKQLQQPLQKNNPSSELLPVYVEGASAPLYLQALKEYPDKRAKKQTFEKLFKQSQLTAEEYVELSSETPLLEIYGIEEEKLYQANLKTRKLIDPERPKILERIENLKSRLDPIKKRFFSPRLYQFDQVSEKYAAGLVSLKEYSLYLEKMYPSIWKHPNYKTVRAYGELVHLEKELSQEKIQKSKEKVLEKVRPFLTERAKSRLTQLKIDYQIKKITELFYYKAVVTLAETLGLKEKELEKYRDYLSKASELEEKRVLLELRQLEKRIWAREYLNEEKGREVLKWMLSLRLAQAFYQEELTKEKWQEYQGMDLETWLFNLNDPIGEFVDYSKVSLKAIAKELEKHDTQREIGLEGGKYKEEELKFLQESYYKLAGRRDKALAENFLEHWKKRKSGRKIAVMIAGGFHTEGITRQLRTEGQSYKVFLAGGEVGKEEELEALAREKVYSSKELKKEYLKRLKRLKRKAERTSQKREMVSGFIKHIEKNWKGERSLWADKKKPSFNENQEKIQTLRHGSLVSSVSHQLPVLEQMRRNSHRPLKTTPGHLPRLEQFRSAIATRYPPEQVEGLEQIYKDAFKQIEYSFNKENNKRKREEIQQVQQKKLQSIQKKVEMVQGFLEKLQQLDERKEQLDKREIQLKQREEQVHAQKQELKQQTQNEQKLYWEKELKPTLELEFKRLESKYTELQALEGRLQQQLGYLVGLQAQQQQPVESVNFGENQFSNFQLSELPLFSEFLSPSETERNEPPNLNTTSDWFSF